MEREREGAPLDRRRFVQRAAAFGAALGGLGTLAAACGDAGDGGGSTSAAAPSSSSEPPSTAVVTYIESVTAPAATGATSAEASTAAAPVGGSITIGTDTVTTLDPAFAAYFADTMGDGAIYEGLVGFVPGTYDIVNQLADVFEPAEDGLSVRFVLKEGVQFHGGFGEVTADDVKFSFERIAGLTDPPLESPYVGDWSPHLKEVRVDGPYEGTILLKTPFAPLMRTTLPALSGMVLSRKAVQERGKSYGSKPIGTGPYEVASFTPSREIVLKRFADWSGASRIDADPAYDEIRIVVSGDPTFVDAALKSGDLDVAGIEGSQLERLQRDDALSVTSVTSLGYEWVGMNTANPALAKLDVRKAIRLAIDVPAIVEVAYEGSATRATAILPPTMGMGYWPDAPVYERDVDAAKALLAAAGVSDLKLSMLVANSPTYFKTIAELVQANLADVGITVDVKLEDPATFAAPNAQTLKGIQLFATGFASFPDPFWSMQWFTSDQIGPGGYNWMAYDDPTFDELNQRAVQELDAAKRSELYVQMQQRWDADANTVWLAWPSYIWAARAEVVPVVRPDGQPVVQAFHPA
jgi:peptide/nickel transport system substrate-binding protein